jgi:hypothetical protein
MGNDDENRRAILARRARYIALALAGMSTATTACASVCLSPPDASLPPRDVNEPDAGNDDADR